MNTIKRKKPATLAEWMRELDEDIKVARTQAGYPLDEDISDGPDLDDEDVEDPPLETHLPRMW